MWKEAEKFLKKDKYIGPLIQIWGSCQIKPKIQKDYFARICGNIIGQQLSGRVADIIEERFVELLNKKVTPENVLKIKEQALRDCGMSWGKVSFLKDLAEKTKSGILKTKNLSKVPDEEVINELVDVKGIGRWTAEMFLIFTLARPDIFPVDDLGIKKGFEKVTKRKWNKVGSAQFAEKHWKPYRSVASWYLWRSLDNR